MTNMMITTIAETIRYTEDKILIIIVTKSVQNAGNAYPIHNLEFIRTAENVNVMKTTVHHCHVIKDANEGMIGSDNKKQS